MAKFKFKYETIKRIKERQEDRIKNELSELESRINLLLEKKDSIIEEMNEFRLQMNGRLTSIEIKFSKDFERSALNHIKEIDANIIKIQLEKEQKMSELIEKKQECKVFSNLKEKHLSSFLFEENKRDIDKMNEIAIRKYARG